MRSKTKLNGEMPLGSPSIGHRCPGQWLASGQEGVVSGGGETILGADKGGGEAVQLAAILSSGL